MSGTRSTKPVDSRKDEYRLGNSSIDPGLEGFWIVQGNVHPPGVIRLIESKW